jgi:hypothetical protein
MIHPLRHGVLGGSSSRSAADGARTVRGGAVVSEQADIRVEAAIDPARTQTHIKDLRECIDDSWTGSHDATMLEPLSQGVIARGRD